MPGVNKVILIGNLGRDPEGKNLESGVRWAHFSLATNETYKNKQGEKVEEVEWHNVVLWGKTAELAEKYLKKGSQVYIEGKNKTRKYEDKEGATRYVTEVHARNLNFLGSASNGGGIPDPTVVPAGIEAGAEDDLPF